MLVFGDPQFTLSAAEVLCRLRELVPRKSGELDSFRRLLIACGQLEQAVADLEQSVPGSRRFLDGIQKITDLAATLFCAEVLECPRQTLPELRAAIQAIQLPDIELTVKVPEGFVFYALYPEQFVFSSLQWAETQPKTNRTVLVVGVRSIGTTLSAIVAATLRSRGWQVDRFSVRPHGHPFQREAKFELNKKAELAIVADEGPGMSGSSMVAVAEELEKAGMARDKISFLPGHPNKPGTAASEIVQHWWKTTASYFVPIESLKWRGKELSQVLLRESTVLSGKRFIRYENVSGGEWRRWAFDSERDWPPGFAPFERLKFRCVAQDGSALLWKFEGLGGLGDNPTEGVSLSPYSVKPVGSCHGFVAYPWIEGARFCRNRVSPEMIRHLVRHIVESARPPLSPLAHQQSLERLAQMTFWNTREVLGENFGKRSVIYLDAAKKCVCPGGYGDGRLAPWEWVRTPEGEIVKTDWRGHDADHTMVGQQSLWWDVAGMLVEWQLSADEEKRALGLLREHGIQGDVATLSFYRNAYCAFQMGKAFLCERIVSDPTEKGRLLKSAESYRDALCSGLTAAT